jgi:ketosteroid isomerase-like protein
MTKEFHVSSEADHDPVSGRASTVLSDLTRASALANDALMRGDIGTYNDLIRIADDFVLMSPFGGAPSLAGDHTPERIQAMGRFFRNGSLTQEMVAGWYTRDMAVLATIERTRVEVGGLPAQDWALRVTQVYRREGEGWVLAHRHADPLHHGVSLETAAGLAKGACSSA